MPPLICAHRGASEYFPENSLQAFRKACELQADSVEIDIRQTRDGQLVACHDLNLSRLCGVPRQLSEITLEEFKRLKINNLEPPASLEEILRELDNNIRIVLDIKERGLEKNILHQIDKFKLKDRVIVSAFDNTVLASMRKLDSEIKTALIAGKFMLLPLALNVCFYLRRTAQAVRADYLHLWYGNSFYKGYRTLIQQGFKISFWTVDDPVDMHRALKLNPFSLITNKPDLARDIVNRQKN